MRSIQDYIQAKFSHILVVTHEEDRLISELRRENKPSGTTPGREVVTWSVSQGIGEKEATGEPVEKVLNHIRECVNPTIYVLKDFMPFLRSPIVTRRLKDLQRHLRKKEVWVVMTSPRREVGPELEEVITILDYDLPDREQLGMVVKAAAKAWKMRMKASEVEEIADALSGLSGSQASNALALSKAQAGKIDRDTVLAEKARAISQDGTVETMRADVTLDDVAGYDELVSWLRQRRRAFSEDARKFGLPVPKGILLVGVPGAGKSLTCKGLARTWGLPLLKCDLGSLYTGQVGGSEANVRKLIKTAEAAAPCVLWLDEIDKGLTSSSGQTSGDSGTSARVLSTLLTWLQEKDKPVYVVATANNPSSLPVELLRRGRWDEIWAMDLPNEQGRKEIFRVHLKKRDRNPGRMDVDALVKMTQGYTGAEIEACVVDGLYSAFNDGGRDITFEDVSDACKKTVPLSTAANSEIEELRSWAKGRARNASGTGTNDVDAASEEEELSRFENVN